MRLHLYPSHEHYRLSPRYSLYVCLCPFVSVRLCLILAMSRLSTNKFWLACEELLKVGRATDYMGSYLFAKLLRSLRGCRGFLGILFFSSFFLLINRKSKNMILWRTGRTGIDRSSRVIRRNLSVGFLRDVQLDWFWQLLGLDPPTTQARCDVLHNTRGPFM